MVQAGDPLELRFKMTVGTAQAGGTLLRLSLQMRERGADAACAGISLALCSNF